MELINATGAPLTICGITLPSRYNPIRMDREAEGAEETIRSAGFDIPVKIVERGKVNILVSPREGVGVIVSREVAEAHPERRDLYFPHPNRRQRKSEGDVAVYDALAQVPAPPPAPLPPVRGRWDS